MENKTIKIKTVLRIGSTDIAVLDDVMRVVTIEGAKISLGKQVEVEDRIAIDKLFPAEIKRGQTWKVQLRHPDVKGFELWGSSVHGGVHLYEVDSVQGDLVSTLGPNGFRKFPKAEFTEAGVEFEPGTFRRFMLVEPSEQS